jgi:hypothetical protein
VRASAGKHRRISSVDVAAAGDSMEVSFMTSDIEVRYAFVCNCAFWSEGDVIVEMGCDRWHHRGLDTSFVFSPVGCRRKEPRGRSKS